MKNAILKWGFAIFAILSFFNTCFGEEKVRILASTFPIYQITRNIIKGSSEELSLLLPPQLGCPHDYSITPQDMRKISNAKILVINGLGMENFIHEAVEKVNPNLVIIDSSLGIEDILTYTHEKASCEHGHKNCAHHHHHKNSYSNVNPHLFVSPRMSAKIAINIARELSKGNPANAEIYTKNANNYSEVLMKLADEMIEMVKGLKNKKIVQPHGVFDYLARDIGLEIIATMQVHGQEPSAAETLELIKKIKELKPGVIVSEPQYSEKMPKTLSNETGIPLVRLDPVVSGAEDSPLDYYEKKMIENIKLVQDTVGKFN